MVENISDTLSFFKDSKGNISYCEQCNSCMKECKQSFRIVAIKCKNYRYTTKENKKEF